VQRATQQELPTEYLQDSGNYTFRVTDGNNCYDTESHFVAPVTPIVATATKLTDVDCRGNNSSIRYNVSGFGTGTYSYTVNEEPQ
jgi:hypothetical protein